MFPRRINMEITSNTTELPNKNLFKESVPYLPIIKR